MIENVLISRVQNLSRHKNSLVSARWYYDVYGEN
jgi:hypothetical protein